MMLALPLLMLGRTQAQTPPLPTFPDDWSSEESYNDITWQGNYVVDPTEGYCCGQGSNCQLQTGWGSGTRYFSYSTRKSRFDDTVFNQIVINDYKLQVEVEIDSATNNTCVSWCPLGGQMYPFDLVDPSAQHMGQVQMNGKTVEWWMYQEKGPFNVTMQTSNSYVDQSDASNSVPVFEFDTLTPFKINLGQSNESWTNWKTGAQDASLFAFTNGPTAGCPKSPNCGNSLNLLRRLKMGDKTFTKAQIRTQMAQEIKDEVSPFAKIQRAGPGPASRKMAGAIPSFPQDYKATETDFIVIPQGDYHAFESSGGQEYWCLAAQSNGKIQTEFQSGPSYVSFSTNQTRFGGALGQQAVVSDYTLMKEFAVDGTNACTAYCPLTNGGMLPLAIDPAAKDLGTAILQGQKYEHFQWSDKILRIVVMDTVDVYADLSDASKPVPYLWQLSITPFNTYLASANTTYTNFVGGAQPADLFAVTGIASCPLSSQCGSSSQEEQ